MLTGLSDKELRGRIVQAVWEMERREEAAPAMTDRELIEHVRGGHDHSPAIVELARRFEAVSVDTSPKPIA